MHAFSLAVCSMLAFPWTNALVCGAHMIASWLHISSTASALLADEAKELGASVEVVPCNLSQVQSVHACLESLIHVEGAIKQMLQKHPNLVVDQQVNASLAMRASCPCTSISWAPKSRSYACAFLASCMTVSESPLELPYNAGRTQHAILL